MGGCRCTYRNCTVRSDGQTHLFHYPVLDKLRCHQWLTNAQRQDFLRLRVSQLKNRVVCQHHFTDDMFMNFKKDKLKHFAVPTEDGPFCDSSNFDQGENEILSPIKVEYIDNESMNIDKKKVFSKKYGDFLTNCEVMEVDPEFDKDLIAKNIEKLDNFKLLGNKSTNVRRVKFMAPVHFPKRNELIQNQNVTSSSNIISNTKPKNNRIKIISEKKITEPIELLASLIPVSPSYVLQKPKVMKSIQENLRQRENTVQVENELEEMFKSPEVVNIQVTTHTVPITFENQNAQKLNSQQSNQLIFQNIEPKENSITFENQNAQNSITFENQNAQSLNSQQSNQIMFQNIAPKENFPVKQMDLLANKPKCTTPTKSLLKNSSQRIISHERIAAIEEKRKFNMKLRDIINDSLNKLDEQVQDVSDKVKSNLEMPNQKVATSEIEPEPELPDSQKYFMELLDKRMKKMEDTLLNRIDINSQHINQLKNTVNRSEKTKRMSIYTQTNLDEEAHKKSIYNEISQYLSSEAKSKVYEELFLNAHSVKRPRTSKRPNRILYASS